MQAVAGDELLRRAFVKIVKLLHMQISALSQALSLPPHHQSCYRGSGVSSVLQRIACLVMRMRTRIWPLPH